MPREKSCTLDFLQEILCDNKKVLKTSDICMLNVGQHWNDWAVKHIWPLIKSRREVHDYLPVNEMEEDKFPDRKFFWGIVCTLLPDLSKQYHAAVMQKKHTTVVNNIN